MQAGYAHIVCFTPRKIVELKWHAKTDGAAISRAGHSYAFRKRCEVDGRIVARIPAHGNTKRCLVLHLRSILQC